VILGKAMGGWISCGLWPIGLAIARPYRQRRHIRIRGWMNQGTTWWWRPKTEKKKEPYPVVVSVTQARQRQRQAAPASPYCTVPFVDWCLWWMQARHTVCRCSSYLAGVSEEWNGIGRNPGRQLSWCALIQTGSWTTGMAATWLAASSSFIKSNGTRSFASFFFFWSVDLMCSLNWHFSSDHHSWLVGWLVTFSSTSSSMPRLCERATGRWSHGWSGARSRGSKRLRHSGVSYQNSKHLFFLSIPFFSERYNFIKN
jgi:hypothetical protein